MNQEEAKARVAAQDAELAGLESQIASLASHHGVPVLMAMMRVLIEMACGAQGEVFHVMNKIKLYRAVMRLLSSKGIR